MSSFLLGVSASILAATNASKESVLIVQSSDTTVMRTISVVGIILCVSGYFYRMTISAVQNIPAGGLPDILSISIDLALNLLFITVAGRVLASGIWDVGHFLGDVIAGDELTMSELLEKLMAINLNYVHKMQESQSIGEKISGIIDIFKSGLSTLVLLLLTWCTNVVAYSMASMSKTFFDNLQVVVFNIAYVFSPLLVGLGSFGETLEIGGKMKAIKLWIDISAWSITMGVVMFTYKGMVFARLAEMDVPTPTTSGTPAHYNLTESTDLGSLTIFLVGCILATPLITSTMLGGASSALAGAGRTFTGVIASAAGFAINTATRFAAGRKGK